MPVAPASAYWRLTRAPRYSLIFALPLLLSYEALAFWMSGDGMAGVRNGADVLLKSLFTALGGRHGLIAFGVLLLGGGAFLVLRDWRRHGPLQGRVFGGVMLGSLLHAAGLGGVASPLTPPPLPGLALPAKRGPLARLGPPPPRLVSL